MEEHDDIGTEPKQQDNIAEHGDRRPTTHGTGTYRVCWYDYVRKGYVVTDTIDNYYDSVIVAISRSSHSRRTTYVFDQADNCIYSVTI